MFSLVMQHICARCEHDGVLIVTCQDFALKLCYELGRKSNKSVSACISEDESSPPTCYIVVQRVLI